MGAKTFRSLHDFVRHGVQIAVSCRGHCQHMGVVDAYSVNLWFKAHRWPTSLDTSFGGHPTDHFRCTKCGNRAGSLRPTMKAVTVTDFFPVGEAGWQALHKRIRHK